MVSEIAVEHGFDGGDEFGVCHHCKVDPGQAVFAVGIQVRHDCGKMLVRDAMYCGARFAVCGWLGWGFERGWERERLKSGL